MKTALLSCFLLAILGLGILFNIQEGFDTLTDKRAWIATVTKWQKAYSANIKRATPQQTSYNTLLTSNPALNRIDNLINPPYNLTDSQISSIYQSETATMIKDMDVWAAATVAAIAPVPTVPTVPVSVPSPPPSNPASFLAPSVAAVPTPSTTQAYQAYQAYQMNNSPLGPAGTPLVLSLAGSTPSSLGGIMQTSGSSGSYKSSESSGCSSGHDSWTSSRESALSDPTKTDTGCPTPSASHSDWHKCPDMSHYIKKDEIPCWNCTL